MRMTLNYSPIKLAYMGLVYLPWFLSIFSCRLPFLFLLCLCTFCIFSDSALSVLLRCGPKVRLISYDLKASSSWVTLKVVDLVLLRAFLQYCLPGPSRTGSWPILLRSIYKCNRQYGSGRDQWLITVIQLVRGGKLKSSRRFALSLVSIWLCVSRVNIFTFV